MWILFGEGQGVVGSFTCLDHLRKIFDELNIANPGLTLTLREGFMVYVRAVRDNTTQCKCNEKKCCRNRFYKHLLTSEGCLVDVVEK